jgi:hypothetical protein
MAGNDINFFFSNTKWHQHIIGCTVKRENSMTSFNIFVQDMQHGASIKKQVTYILWNQNLQATESIANSNTKHAAEI